MPTLEPRECFVKFMAYSSNKGRGNEPQSPVQINSNMAHDRYIYNTYWLYGRIVYNTCGHSFRGDIKNEIIKNYILVREWSVFFMVKENEAVCSKCYRLLGVG